ncbi:MAG TPA: hypothetical protein VG454_12905, partial [Gemmatimonadales bacterium]|nr:hypothetical protein [Gemmatimonadales bacterium]
SRRNEAAILPKSMATFLYSAALGLLLAQNPPSPATPPTPPAPPAPEAAPGSSASQDTLRASVWARVAADSTDGSAWLDVGRYYLTVSANYHAHKKPVALDTVVAHAILDTAQLAFDRSARLSTGTRTADSARVYRVYAFGERAYVDWESGGTAAATLAWHGLPENLRLPPVLEELGENLLRACPHQGILFTAGEMDTQAAWYLRFARGLRPDLIVLPLDRWKSDSVLRNRVLRELKTRDPSLRALGEKHAICASMGFERPPEQRPEVKWNKRPLVWVSGREEKGDRVSPQDFVFAALRLAVDEHETWTEPVAALYKRAVSNVGGLCKAFETFQLGEEVGCR